MVTTEIKLEIFLENCSEKKKHLSKILNLTIVNHDKEVKSSSS